MNICNQCKSPFEITDSDRAFYDRVSPVIAGKKYAIPEPALCPDCRQRQRFAFRNEYRLYHRKCDLTGKQLVALYSPDKPYIVYDQSAWWSDRYDPLEYGRDFDFSRPFFEQFDELNRSVPKAAIQNARSENCAYTNYSAGNKNCYMAVGSMECENCLYSYRVTYSKDLVDCYDVQRCERCYECSESGHLYACVQCANCQHCADCTLCDSCTNCRDCFGCVNLNGKQFYIYNLPFTEAEYRKKVTVLKRLQDPLIQRDIQKLHLSAPHRYATIIHSENATGDQLWDCRNVRNCYTLKGSEDCADCAVGEGNRDCRDANFFDLNERLYQCTNQQDNYQGLFSALVWYCREYAYCMNSFSSQNLFGCTGMKKQQYCILNKQYAKSAYDNLASRIISHMQKTGEWGQFFPIQISPFAYNETTAQDYYPLTQTETEGLGGQWHQSTETRSYKGPHYEIPDIRDVTDDICKQILICEKSGKPYKIIPQELKFYREMDLPLPRRAPDQRHLDRLTSRNPRRLWPRACAKCAAPIQTTYAPERPEKVYCEACYLKEVY